MKSIPMLFFVVFMLCVTQWRHSLLRSLTSATDRFLLTLLLFLLFYLQANKSHWTEWRCLWPCFCLTLASLTFVSWLVTFPKACLVEPQGQLCEKTTVTWSFIALLIIPSILTEHFVLLCFTQYFPHLLNYGLFSLLFLSKWHRLLPLRTVSQNIENQGGWCPCAEAECILMAAASTSCCSFGWGMWNMEDMAAGLPFLFTCEPGSWACL